ncbi:MAG: tetratricopeptide repeat protein [Phycisphaerales bacterium]|nr:MAG: tetratricopeptide repeat protein [Phycisphaerales bacterium]
MNPARITLTAVLASAVCVSAALATDTEPTPARQAFNLRMEGKSDEAAALLRRSLEANPDDALTWFELARTEFYHFQLDEATETIARAIELAPDNADFQYFAGIAAGCNAVDKFHHQNATTEGEQQLANAIAAFRQAVTIDPDHHDARIMLINMLVETPKAQGGDAAEAEKHAQALEALDAVRGVEARCMLMGDDRPEAAIELWKKTVDSHPDRADAHAGLARALLSTGDLEAAAAEIDKAMQVDSKQRNLLLALCRQLVSAEDRAGAEKAAQRYLETEPLLPAPMRAFGMFYLAVLQKQQGNRDRADALLAEAQQIDPHLWTTYMEPPEVLFEAP